MTLLRGSWTHGLRCAPRAPHPQVPIFAFALSANFALGSGCTICASVLYAWKPDLSQLLGGSGAKRSEGERELEPLQEALGASEKGRV